jgi:hypothetical protein
MPNTPFTPLHYDATSYIQKEKNEFTQQPIHIRQGGTEIDFLEYKR